MASRRILISGLGQGGEAEVRQRAVQMVGRIERFGLRAVSDSLYISASGFAFINVTADEGVDDKVDLVRKTLSGTTWKGSKLRIGDADPDWRARLESERKAAAQPHKKRVKVRGNAVQSTSIGEPVTPDHLEWGWKQTAGGHLVRPLVMRPSKPIPPPSKTDSRTEGKCSSPASSFKPRTSRTRSRLLTIDPTRYTREHLAGSLLDSDAPSLPPDAIWVCETQSDEEGLPETVCWKLRDSDGSVLEEEQVQTSSHWRGVNGQAAQENLMHTVPPTSLPVNNNLPDATQDVLHDGSSEIGEESSSSSEDEMSSDGSELMPIGGAWQRSAYDPAQEDAYSDGYNEQEHVDQSVDKDVSRAVLARLFGKGALKADAAALPSNDVVQPQGESFFDKPVANTSGAWWSVNDKAEVPSTRSPSGSQDALFDKPVVKSNGAWWASEASAPTQESNATVTAPLSAKTPSPDSSSSAPSPGLDSSDSNSDSDSSSDSGESASESSSESSAEPPAPAPASVETGETAISAGPGGATAPIEPPVPTVVPSRRALLLGLASTRAAPPSVSTAPQEAVTSSGPDPHPVAPEPTPAAASLAPVPVPLGPKAERNYSSSHPEEASASQPALEIVPSVDGSDGSPPGPSGPTDSGIEEQKEPPSGTQAAFQTHYELGELKTMFEPHVAELKKGDMGGGGFSFAALADEEDMDEEMDWGAAEPVAEPEPEPDSVRFGNVPPVAVERHPLHSAGVRFPLTAPGIPNVLTRLEHHRIEGHTYFVPFGYQHQASAPDLAEQLVSEAKGNYTRSRSVWKRRRWDTESARKHART